MRKYIKNMRQQNENKSSLFKQAKKMFHYQPTSQNKPFSYSKQNKNHNRPSAKQFKDDFSSVKDNKVENNEINQSSWIGRLVNGIQDHSLEDLRVYSKQIEKRLSDSVENLAKEKEQEFESEKIMIVDQRKATKTRFQEKVNKSMDVEAPTKKNSINVAKKKSDTFTQKKYKASKKKNEAEQNQVAQKQNLRSASQSKGQARSLSRNISQSLIAKTEVSTKKEFKDISSKKRSLQNIYIYKGTQQSKSKFSMNEDCKVQTLHSVQKKTHQKDKSSNAKVEEVKFNESISEMQEIKCLTDNKTEVMKQTENKQKNASILDDSFSEPLFQESKRKLEQVRVQKRIAFGLIRKNNRVASNRQEKASTSHSLKQDQLQTKISPKFNSNPLDNKNNIASNNQGQEDYVSARQQKQLVDKYLRKDYSFKCYTSKNTDVESNAVKQVGIKKNSQVKYKYQYNHNRHQKIIQKQQAQPLKEDMYFSRSYKTEYNAQNPNNQCNQPSAKYQLQSKNFCYKKQKYSSLPNRAPQPFTTHVQQIGPNKLVEIVENRQKITKEAYLHDSIDSTLADISSIGFKYEQVYQLKGKIDKNKQHLKPSNPSKYFYLIQNSMEREGDRINPSDKENSFRKKDAQSIDGSGKLIDRLNSKLTTYINQHHLIKQEPEPEEWNVGEATYRTVRLNFNQLKKHR